MLMVVALTVMMAQEDVQTAQARRMFSGAGLLDLCEKVDDKVYGVAAATCHGYIEGLSDTVFQYEQMLAVAAGSEARGMRTCLPEGATYDQYTRVVVKYLRDHPEKLHEPRGGLAYDALVRAFPCERIAPPTAP